LAGTKEKRLLLSRLSRSQHRIKELEAENAGSKQLTEPLPVANIVLAGEINRTPPKSQAALLEGP